VGQYPLWIADYNGKDTPGDNLIWKTWAGFQYSEVGNIGGISPLDLDEFTSTVFIKEGPLMDVTAALTILKEAGIITEPTYWSNLAQYVKYLDELLINMAQKLEVGK
jgi:hypothetical protein